jgi:hypothetical protein
MTAPQILAVSNTTTELSPEENELLLSAINLSSQEKSVAAELKDVKVQITELFTKRFDVAKTGTIAKLGKSSIQVKRKAGKVVLTDELLELANNIEGTELINSMEERVKNKDIDFSEDGQLRHCYRLLKMARESSKNCVIINMACPLPKMRDILNPDIIIWAR